MQITCLGAAGMVTGSCYLLDYNRKYLVDCGLFQGGKTMDALNREEWRFNPREVTALFLTHAHVDHCGRIPKLVRDGFNGKIYCTLPTAELCKIMLLDSANIQEMESEWQSRKSRRRGEPDAEPLYTVADAEACLNLFEVVEMDEMISFDHHLKVRFRDAGHILGSSIIEIWCGTPPDCHKVVFSGDLGRKDQLIVNDSHRISNADSLFIESTYGNRNHKSFEDSKNELLEAIRYSIKYGEKVIIPAFAVERTQEILYILGDFFRQHLIPSIPVYIDSPLAIAATEIFRRMHAFYDTDTMTILNHGHKPFDFPELVLSRTARDSMEINERSGPAIVIAGNGMCTAGRIKHHLKHNLWRQGASLVIAGFQAEGTLGRKIVEGARTVRVFGEEIMVRARVFTIGGFSAHAGQSELLEWLSCFENPRMQVYVVHGERSSSEEFARLVRERFKLSVRVPEYGETINLVPVEREVTVEEAETPVWQQHVADLTRKAKELKAVWQHDPGIVPPQLLQEMEEELTRIRATLDTILQQARTRGSGLKEKGLRAG